MYGKEIRAFRPNGKSALVADGNLIYNMTKNTTYRIVAVADVYAKISKERADLIASPAGATDILLPIGVHFLDVGPFGFLSISSPGDVNIIQIEPI